MNIPKSVQAGLWQYSVSLAEAFFKSLPRQEPLTKRKVMETVYARFAYVTAIDVIRSADSSSEQWEQDISHQRDAFRSLLLGLVDDRFDQAFKILQSGDLDAIALKRRDDYYSQLSSAHPHHFFDPVIEVLVEIDYRWFTHSMANSAQERAERLRRVSNQVLSEVQIVVDSMRKPE